VLHCLGGLKFTIQLIHYALHLREQFYIYFRQQLYYGNVFRSKVYANNCDSKLAEVI